MLVAGVSHDHDPYLSIVTPRNECALKSTSILRDNESVWVHSLRVLWNFPVQRSPPPRIQVRVTENVESRCATRRTNDRTCRFWRSDVVDGVRTRGL